MSSNPSPSGMVNADFGDQLRDQRATPGRVQFTSLTVPDVTNKTRVVAVCGIKQGMASPLADGWMLADMMAFWNILEGATKAQRWIHNLDLQRLVSMHKEYLHGDPSRERTVVLDAHVLSQMQVSKHPPERIGGNEKLALKVHAVLEMEIAEAKKSGDPLLVMAFAHGQPRFGISLGGQKADYFSHEGLRKLLENAGNVNVTLLTNSWYSAGWSVQPGLNISFLTAAGADDPNSGWVSSGSIGRHGGSRWATEIAEQMTSDISIDMVQEASAEQIHRYHESMRAFGAYTYRLLLEKVDRRGFQHEITFSAQDDAWSENCSARTGMPLKSMQERWKKLQKCPKSIGSEPRVRVNEDITISLEVGTKHAGRTEREAQAERSNRQQNWSAGHEQASAKCKVVAPLTGSWRGFRKFVAQRAMEYKSSFPGYENAAPNHHINHLINELLGRRSESASDEDVQETFAVIDYRMGQMDIADHYISMMRLPMPNGQPCCQCDVEELMLSMPNDHVNWIWQSLRRYEVILFSEPSENQGRSYRKGASYLVASFCIADWNRDKVEAKLAELAAAIQQDMEVLKNKIKGDEEHRRFRSDLFSIFNLLGSMSPNKRRPVV